MDVWRLNFSDRSYPIFKVGFGEEDPFPSILWELCQNCESHSNVRYWINYFSYLEGLYRMFWILWEDRREIMCPRRQMYKAALCQSRDNEVSTDKFSYKALRDNPILSWCGAWYWVLWFLFVKNMPVDLGPVSIKVVHAYYRNTGPYMDKFQILELGRNFASIKCSTVKTDNPLNTHKRLTGGWLRFRSDGVIRSALCQFSCRNLTMIQSNFYLVCVNI